MVLNGSMQTVSYARRLCQRRVVRLMSSGSTGLKMPKISDLDPLAINENHIGRVVTIPSESFHGPNNVYQFSDGRHYWTTSEHVAMCYTVGSNYTMIRRPAVEIIDYMTRYAKLDEESRNLPFRIVLHGKHGNGKSLTLTSLMFHLDASDVITLNFGNLIRWIVKNRLIGKSVHNTNRFDHIEDSNDLLRNFYAMNKEKLADLKTSKTYNWSERESSPAGISLADVAKTGVDRAQFSTDCLNVLLVELSEHCRKGDCRFAILVDGINLLFREMSLVNADTERSVHRDNVFKEGVTKSIPGPILITTVDNTIVSRFTGKSYMSTRHLVNSKYEPDTTSDMPFACLGQEGWESLHPFIPIAVPPFDRGELDSLIDFLSDCGYMSNSSTTEVGRDEIQFLTSGNGNDFRQWSALW